MHRYEDDGREARPKMVGVVQRSPPLAPDEMAAPSHEDVKNALRKLDWNLMSLYAFYHFVGYHFGAVIDREQTRSSVHVLVH